MGPARSCPSSSAPNRTPPARRFGHCEFRHKPPRRAVWSLALQGEVGPPAIAGLPASRSLFRKRFLTPFPLSARMARHRPLTFRKGPSCYASPGSVYPGRPCPASWAGGTRWSESLRRGARRPRLQPPADGEDDGVRATQSPSWIPAERADRRKRLRFAEPNRWQRTPHATPPSSHRFAGERGTGRSAALAWQAVIGADRYAGGRRRLVPRSGGVCVPTRSIGTSAHPHFTAACVGTPGVPSPRLASGSGSRRRSEACRRPTQPAGPVPPSPSWGPGTRARPRAHPSAPRGGRGTGRCAALACKALIARTAMRGVNGASCRGAAGCASPRGA